MSKPRTETEFKFKALKAELERPLNSCSTLALGLLVKSHLVHVVLMYPGREKQVSNCPHSYWLSFVTVHELGLKREG